MYRAGFEYGPKGAVERFDCRDCGHKFSGETTEMNERRSAFKQTSVSKREPCSESRQEQREEPSTYVDSGARGLGSSSGVQDGGQGQIPKLAEANPQTPDW